MVSKTKKLFLLVTPSPESAVIIVVLSLLTIIVNYLNGLESRNPVREVLQQNFQYLAPYYSSFTDSLTNHLVLSNSLLLLFWSTVGAIIYIAASHLYGLVTKSIEIEKTLFYVNINRERTIENLLVSFAVRSAAFFAWLIYCLVFFGQFMPYIVSTVKELVGSPVIDLVMPVVQVLLVLSLAFHIHIVLLRLISLRVRLFEN